MKNNYGKIVRKTWINHLLSPLSTFLFLQIFGLVILIVLDNSLPFLDNIQIPKALFYTLYALISPFLILCYLALLEFLDTNGSLTFSDIFYTSRIKRFNKLLKLMNNDLHDGWSIRLDNVHSEINHKNIFDIKLSNKKTTTFISNKIIIITGAAEKGKQKFGIKITFSLDNHYLWNTKADQKYVIEISRKTTEGKEVFNFEVMDHFDLFNVVYILKTTHNKVEVNYNSLIKIILNELSKA